MPQSLELPNKVTLKFTEIRVLEYKFAPPINIIISPQQVYQFDFEIKLFVNPPLNRLGSDFIIKIFADPEKSEMVCQITTRQIVEIKELTQILTSQNNSLPIELVRQIVSAHIGLARGILYSKNLGTFLQNVYLPPVDVQELIKESPLFNIK